MKTFAMTMNQCIDPDRSGVGPMSRGELLAATTLTDITVESIDSTGLNITVQTAGNGDKLSMPVVSPEVMKGVTVGEHVSLELDVQGKVVKILKLAPAPKEEGGPEPGA
ncbi:MAG: hypothetical protein E6K65_17700 [Nitrospirae bacterium]|nr:MAG: hypothetical protein E6K65_17700 [Nitrospirota bacterium]